VASKINLNKFFVIILAAGMGRRLGKSGKYYPKTLIKINEVTILDRIIELLKKYKYRKLHFILGFKHKKILDILKFKKIEFTYSISKKYKETGHGYSWFLSKRKWQQSCLPVIVMHADILFSHKYLENILNAKSKNIIGSRKINGNKKINNIYKISTDNNLKITKISKKININKATAEVIGINKFSQKTQLEIFNFFQSSFKNKKNMKLGWEDLLNKHIIASNTNLLILKNQNFNWVNVNRKKDVQLAKKLNFK